ncbi:PP2C family serine/threonine-protein phosphatase [Rubrimonas cliftonensis]|uniref:PP2C family serine/threonine-protein phosphatase n=1 Tax=Rubrimonas cliftonensis TaxID=89524 RepID=UPI000A91A245|nr:PP2C family serine/threonine-protein phosphatase [Rubrimonas cliftonensis]
MDGARFRPGWRVAAARVRGESHARRAERGQDALCVRLRGGAIIVAAADGAGSAPRGGAGAALASRAVVREASAALGAQPSLSQAREEDLRRWAEAARAAVAAAAETCGLAPRDCAATLLIAVSDGATTLWAHVGDGAVVARDAGAWRALSWPAAGAHAGETHFLTDEPFDLRTGRLEGTVDALALLTDGIERLVLDFATETPHAPFFERMARPVAALPAPGRDAALSQALARYLGGAAVAARTDDDRTLVLAALAAP